MPTKAAKSNLSVLKTIHIIEILARAHEPMRLSELAAQSDMPPSTTLSMVNTLVECGYAYQEEHGQQRYGLTMRFLQIGQLAADHFSIRDVAHPFLVSLAQETRETCCLSIDDHGCVRYLDVVENAQSNILIRQRIGGSAPMHCTGSGKILLSKYTPEALDDLVAQHGLPQMTSHTITSPDELRYEVAKSIERGYSMDDEECEIGMRCMAAPIYGSSGKVTAALSLSGPISRMTKMRCEVELYPRLQAYAEQITQKIGGQNPVR